MNWFINFLTSSIGRKVLMSLTGLFLILFLVIHLIGNFQLLLDDGGDTFNLYAKKMTTDPIIKTVSYLLYASILLHAIQGLILWGKNRAARGGQRYAVKVTRATSSTLAGPAKNMGWMGTIILIFILIHMYQFWLQMKMGYTPIVSIEGKEIKDLYTIVQDAYSNIGFVIFYVISMIVIAFHLLHGFPKRLSNFGLKP